MFVLAALLAAGLPAFAFALAPLVLGPLHVVVGASVLARTQPDPRAFRFGFALVAVLFVGLELLVAPHVSRASISRVELLLGLVWALATVSATVSSRLAAREAQVLCALAWTAYATLAFATPVALLALLVAAHNVVSIAIGLRARGRSLAPVAIGLVVCLALATFTHAGGREPVARAIGVADRRLALGFLYLQLAHYAVWLAELPRLRCDRVALALMVLAAVVSVALFALAPRLGGLAKARSSYLSIAAFHVLAELVAITSRLLRPARGALTQEARSS